MCVRVSAMSTVVTMPTQLGSTTELRLNLTFERCMHTRIVPVNNYVHFKICNQSSGPESSPYAEMNASPFVFRFFCTFAGADLGVARTCTGNSFGDTMLSRR
jgi:hypothetical protein